MKPQHVPSIGTKYWIALILASIFGANTGDFLSDALRLGHIKGLPFLAALFAIVLIIERFDSSRHTAYFWSAIIIIRTSATNIGDIGHDWHLKAPWVMATFTLVLLATLLWWQTGAGQRRVSGSSALSTKPVYWWCMLLAGALGTVLGDYFSFGLKLGTLYSALTLAIPLIFLFLIGRNGLLTTLPYYFLTVVVIRAAGTAAGDYIARHFFGLPLSTLISGAVFVTFLLVWREGRFSISAPYASNLSGD